VSYVLRCYPVSRRHPCVALAWALQTNNEMSLSQGLQMAFDFDIIPDVCNHKQFRELWKLVNRSEAYVAQSSSIAVFATAT
jgi:hypothetical protein